MRTLRSLLGLFYWTAVLLALVAVAGVVIWADRNGLRADGRVVAKRAVVYGLTTGNAPGQYGYHYYADISFRLDPGALGVGRWGFDEQRQVAVDVSEIQFDSLVEGQAVSVRYLPWLPGFARLEQQSLWDLMLVRVPWSVALSAGFWLACILACWQAWRAFRRGGGARGVVAWVAVALALIAAGNLRPFDQVGHGAPVPATVQTVNRITERPTASDTMPMLQPYQRVALEYVPAGMSAPVLAVDEIDDGSVAGLQKGAVVSVTYDPRAPRAARIVGATRSFAFINTLPYLGVGLLLALAAVAQRARRRFAATGRQPGSQQPRRAS